MKPTLGNGKICYLEIPASDVDKSREFYERCFGWAIRRHEDGSVSFDDGVGEVSGMWVTGRPPMKEAGIVISIMVEDIAKTIEAVIANGGMIVKAVSPNEPEVTAWFRDPGGNLMGLYHDRHLSK